MNVILRQPFDSVWRAAEAFDRVAELQGEVIRHKEGRRTLRFEFQGNRYYLKHHKGVGWGEIAKSFSQLKWPVLSAVNEWRAINQLRALGMETLTPVAFGVRGLNPANRESFLITEELTGILSLAKFAEPWPRQPPSYALKHRLVTRVAEIARALHSVGINHRDLYICHFLLKLDSLQAEKPALHVVDLHRAQIRDRVPRRWRVKDLASIYFSAMDIGLTRRDVYRFLQVYFQQPWREVLQSRGDLLQAVEKRAIKLYRRDFGRDPGFQLGRDVHG